MKKLELIASLTNNNVKSSNLRSSINAQERKAIEGHGFEKVKGWLAAIEEKESAKIESAYEKKVAKSFGMSRKQYLQLMRKANQILACFNTGHSMGCYRKLTINGNIFQRNDVLETYAKSCKYTPTYGSITIDLSKKDLIEIRNVQGLWTISKADGTAKWLVETGSKKTHSVEFSEGFLYKESHSSMSLHRAKEIQGIKDVKKALTEANDQRFVGAAHIRATGACIEGIQAFCNRYNLNVDHGYNIEFLRGLDTSLVSPYLNKVQK